MKYMYMKTIYFILLMLIVTKVDAQLLPPNDLTAGIFKQYPQSSFTGVPSINIPVYDLNYKGLSFPIQLSYNSNLVKPINYSGWVGLGWNLDVGGRITRAVRDKPDEVNYYQPGVANYSNELNVGFYNNYGFLANSDWDTENRILSAVNDQSNYSYSKITYPYRYTIKDYAPDEFSFSIGDISGSFFLDHQGEWKVKCNSDVRVIINAEDFKENPYSFGGITYPNHRYLFRISLIDTRGIKYVFLSTPVSGVGVAHTWYIDTIVFRTGETIKYKYENGPTISVARPLVYHYNSGIWSNIFYSMGSHYIKSIETELQRILFYRDEKPGELAQLDSIKVISRLDSANSKKIAFEYQNSPMNRLKLTNVIHMDTANSVIMQYDIRYNSKEFTSTNTDHWGYFSLKPRLVGSFSNFYTSRNADTLNCRAELLSSITYPTKGYVKYTWEPNDYSKGVPIARSGSLELHSSKQYTGGVRIKNITSYDQSNQIIGSKSYAYVANYSPSSPGATSSGILYGNPQYTYIRDNDFNDMYYYDPQNLGSSNGGHITYSEVAEINLDGSYSVTNFSNYDAGVNGEYMDEPALKTAKSAPVYSVHSYTSNSHEHGFPLMTRTYAANNILVAKRTVEYERFDKNNAYVRAYELDVFPESNWIDGTFNWIGAAVKIYTNSYLQKKITEMVYDINGANPVTSVKEFSYDSHKQVKEILEKNSRSETISTVYKYPYDFSSQPVMYEMNSRNFLSPIIQSDVDKVDGINRTPLNTQKNNYSFWNSNNQIYPSTIENKIGSASLEISQQFHSYDDKGNILSLSNGIGPKSGKLWGYSGNYLIAESQNASKEEIYHENFESSSIQGVVIGGAHTGKKYFSGANYSLNWAIPNSRPYLYSYWYRINNEWKRKSPEIYSGAVVLNLGDAYDDILIYPSDAFVKTYTYKPLTGMTSMIDAKGLTTYYEYDTFQRLLNIKDRKGNILKHYTYNYIPSPIFYSEAKSQLFTKNDCPAGKIGDAVIYNVPQGKYTSTIDQAAANQKAEYDIQTKGQSYANSNGTCISTFTLGYGIPYGTDFQVNFYNTVTGISYYYGLSNSYGEIQDIPQGTYNVTINEISNGGVFDFYFNSTVVSGTSAQFGPTFFDRSVHLEVIEH